MKLRFFVLVLMLFLTACGGEPQTAPSSDDATPQPEGNEVVEIEDEPVIPEEPAETTRPRSEWTLYVNGGETEAFLIVDDEDYLLVPVEETVVLLGGEFEKWEHEGTHGVFVTIGDNDAGFYLEDRGVFRDIDGSTYMHFNALYQLYGIHSSINIKNKTLFMNQTEIPWTLYVDGTPVAFNVQESEYYYLLNRSSSNINQFSSVHAELNLSVPFEALMLSLGAEFIEASGWAWDSMRHMNYNGKDYQFAYMSSAFEAWSGVEGNYQLNTFDGIFSADVDTGLKNIYFSS